MLCGTINSTKYNSSQVLLFCHMLPQVGYLNP
ncbi:hypothetical protein ISKNV_00113 [Infectious spleen and kidney necrosis virus]|nr:hypothetical protein ISKNV_00113 [Infectious spleen and kidney necrosis virus]